MSKMLKVADNFQYSINIAYDLNDDEKLKNFIPSTSSIDFIEEVLSSTLSNRTDRARILIGSYGRGKSHIVLSLLALLQGKSIDKFEKAKSRFLERKIFQENNFVKNILPVVISGSYESMTQAFLQSLHQTLRRANLADIMPETNYKAAICAIEKWEKSYRATFDAFEAKAGSAKKFIARLEHFDFDAYKTFCALYPELTAGGEFNPFISSDVSEIYKSCSVALKTRGYNGIFVVYDEFSKFLESSIQNTATSDTKMLQDFAEMCSRSGENELHLLLISHKEIANYIDKLPKQKTDGWRGISERFKHVHLNDNFSEMYEIISQAIEKDGDLWKNFRKKHEENFNKFYSSELEKNCYPLHRVSNYILPRLSEKIAQNERTLFTFLSAKGKSTLSEFLAHYDDESFKLLTPDVIYDYFEPILRKDFSFQNHSVYTLTERILQTLGESENNLEAKIIKTISLICMLEQYEKLSPTYERIESIYRFDYSFDEIKAAIDDLIEKKCVVYLKRSNSYLKLKESSGVNIKALIADEIEKRKNAFSVKDVLNKGKCYFYPYRYNDEKEMTRFFLFSFVESVEDCKKIKSENAADGYVFALLKKENLADLQKLFPSDVFIIRKQPQAAFTNLPFEKQPMAAAELDAVESLKAKAADDEILSAEYQIIYDDLREIVNEVVESYTHPEKKEAQYFHNGKELVIKRKADLSEKLSVLCDELYPLTPVINNEVINKNEITAQAFSSRSKIIAGLLRRDIEKNLGLLANGQDVSIMRSTLLRTHILSDDKITLNTGNLLIDNVLKTIEDFVKSASSSAKNFAELYAELSGAEKKIALRRGLIPIYIAAVFHNYRKAIVIKNTLGEEKSLCVETINEIDKNPAEFTLTLIDWNSEKEEYLFELSNLFAPYIVKSEQELSEYEYVYKAILRYYRSLPKSSTAFEMPKKYAEFLNLLKQNVGSEEFLFSRLPKLFSVDEVKEAKIYFDTRLEVLEKNLFELVNATFDGNLKEWTQKQDRKFFGEDGLSISSKVFSLFLSYFDEKIDKNDFICALVLQITALQIEYLDEKSIELFKNRLESFKNSFSSAFAKEKSSEIGKNAKDLQQNPRARLLFNKITDALDTFGLSLSAEEKRQVLIDVLQGIF